MTELQKELFKLQDLSYRDFCVKLVPSINKETIIGIRTPKLRKLAKEVFKNGDYKGFIECLPHEYYEENNLHGLLIEQVNDYDACIEAIEKFLPYVDNWATCDLLRPKVFKNHLSKFLERIKMWIVSDKPYTIRFGVEMLMCYYLEDEFNTEYLSLVANIKSDEYYVNMMLAWYFATALTKQYDATIPYLENRRLSKWVHNKTIQKAVESYRIYEEHKEYLKSLKIY